MKSPLPNYLKREYANVKEERAAKTKFLLRLAALYADESNSMQSLARTLGYKDESTLATYMSRSLVLPLNTAIAIERLVGRDIVSREDFRPDIFDIENDDDL